MFELDDIEIETLTPGPIIHLFPKHDPYEAVEKILKSLYLMNDIEQVVTEMSNYIKEKEQPDYILMAFAELQRLLKKSLLDSEKYSLEFMEKKNFHSKA